jgi:hypothetical protein
MKAIPYTNMGLMLVDPLLQRCIFLIQNLFIRKQFLLYS